jgi:hypothetical protein
MAMASKKAARGTSKSGSSKATKKAGSSKASKKAGSSKTSRKAGSSKAVSKAGIELTIRGKEGSSGKATAVDFDRSTRGGGGLALAVEAPPPVMPQIPRPATTRFPIDVQTFLSLKSRAETISPAQTGAEIVSDRRGRRSEAPVAMTALAAAAPSAAAVAPLQLVSNFPGLPDNGWFPYDAALAAGPEHVMVSINAMVGFYAKSNGGLVMQKTLAQWFSNVVTNAKVFDPKVLYDQFAGRWVLLAVGLATNPNRSWFLLSVSATSDPRGRWFNYALDASRDGTTATNNWADYPGLGVDNQALYITANMFRHGGGFEYAKLRVIPKQKLYAGTAITYSDFVRLSNADGSQAFTVQPCHTFGAPGAQYLVNTLYPTAAQPAQNRLTIWTVTNPVTGPTLTRKTMTIAPYSLPPDADQRGGGTPLDSGDIRVLNAVYSGGSVWCTFTTGHSWSGTNRASCFWLQLKPSVGSILQQGIFGASTGSYFYPSVMADVNGNAILTFARCGTSEFASMYFTGRQTTDPAGQLRASVLLKAGTANYTRLDGSGRNRWGDYTGIGLDPVDSRTIWFYNGYASGGAQFGTQIGAARF